MVVLQKNLSLSINAEGPLTFSQALRDKYVDQDEIDNTFTLPKDEKISTAITFVGFGKVTSVQKQLYRLTSIDLSKRNIQKAGNLEEILGSLDRVQILDLADNLLTWSQVSAILICLPNLCDLILTKNPLESEFTQDPRHPIRPRGLSSLTMGQIFLDWTEFTGVLSGLWPSIDQLDLWSNQLTPSKMKLKSNEAQHLIRSLKSLKLSFNHFPDLTWIEDIGPIDNLVELDISNCKLERIDISSELESKLLRLQLLNVSYNNIGNWEAISSLHKLKHLRSLICHENPIFIREKHAKSLTIGRLGTIKYLNREEITRNMRTDSEIFYIRSSFPEYQAYTKGENLGFKSVHPRYEELAREYGLPEDLVRKQVVEKYINVELALDDKTVSKRLPCDMRVANLRMLCKRLFHLKPSSNISITCCDPDKKLSYELDKDGQTLHFFSVKNGRRLLIQQLD